MNGYEMTAQSYEALLQRNDPNISAEDCQSKIKVYRTLASLTNDEIKEIFNSGAYNNVLKGYSRLAMQNCGIDDEKINEVMGEIKWLLDTMSAADAEIHA